MLWLKALHLIFMVTWFAGLFYLPRLFVYHAQSGDQTSRDRFVLMERKLFFGIMTPSMLLTFIFGVWMLAAGSWAVYSTAMWLHIKLTLLLLLLVYHLACYKWLLDFKHERSPHGHIYFRLMNEVPVLLLLAIVILATVKPF